ncbi:MAG: hypothetical protein KC546_13660 [Anaerolineae bacterium]|nr:hypothetical protein [Anaerolineae bacterium]MCA9889419.1 hypothetical protein [Anaerolineae bacterium]MCA9891519.1 hypothetical protein [Anaerolineae bacterium]
MKNKEKELKNEAVVEEAVDEPNKKRNIKVIFTPVSIAFYFGLGYFIYRRIRNKFGKNEPEPILTTA